MSYNFITKMSLQGRGERKGRGGRKESEKKTLNKWTPLQKL